MGYNNLSKTFKYVNELGDMVIFDYNNGYLINKPTGIDTLAVSMSKAKGINQIGDVIQSKNIQSRPINITGVLVNDFQTQGKEKLLSVIRPDLKGRLYADDYYIGVMPTKTPTIEPAKSFARFSLSLLAPYPYWQNKANKTTALTGLTPMFRLPCNFSKPYRFASSVKKQFYNVINRGQIATPFTLTLLANGTCVKPKITNIKTKDFLKLNKTLQAGERIVIKIAHDEITVVSSIDGDVDGTLSIDSNLFLLETGDNVLKPEAESGLDSLEITVEFNEEKVGITL